MNDNQPWPVMGQAAASSAAQVLARYARWQLVACAAYHGLPLAGFLHDETTALLVAVTDGPLDTASAAMRGALVTTRSDGLIIGRMTSDGLPEIALGLWRSGDVTRHMPLLPWLGSDDVMWVVPANNAACRPVQAYKLVARYLRGDVLPWQTVQDLRLGFDRAIVAFAGCRK